jgi:hypothetical protein
MTTRGIRNNNPGNIDRNATKWQGMAADQSGDPRFIVFKTPQYGIRAIARLILTYQNQHGLNTIRKIIGRWAPPNENNTSAYVKAVAASCGVLPDDVIDADSIGIMLPLVKAIITHENGSSPYSDALVLEGIHMAGVSDAKPKPLVKQNTFIAQAATGLSVVGAGVAQYAPQVKDAADKLSGYTGAPIIAHAVTILLTIAGLCVLAGMVSQILKQRAQ